MKKFFLLLFLLVLLGSSAFAGLELTTLWEKSAAQDALPAWFDTGHLTRGFAYGHVGDNDRVFVVSRNGGSMIYSLDAATGDSVGRLENFGITGGTYAVSDVGVSDDGIIYVCNLSINSSLKVYAWDSEADTATVVVSHTYSGRLGDKMTVVGSAIDNSLAIYAASANSNDVLMFTTADSGKTFSADTIAIGYTGGSASVGPLPSGDFYWNAGGNGAKKFSATGSELGAIPGSVVATGSNAIRYITTTGDWEYFLTFQYGGGNENARLVRTRSANPTEAVMYSLTPILGTNSNVNGTGDVAVRNNGDGTFNVYVLSTNNGIGAYKVQFPVPPQDPVNMTLNGDVKVGDLGFFQNDHNTRGMGYNAKTDHALVASRTGGAFIYVLNAGVVIDTLDMTGVTGGTYTLNKVVADTAGVIYACNLALANGNYKMYRWENEQAAPTVAFEGTVVQRSGDAMSLSGSGTGTVLYVSGSASNQVDCYTSADGISFSAAKHISIAAGTARGGISATAEGLGADLWINGSGTTVQKIDTAGTVLAEIPAEVIASSWMNVAFMAADNGANLLAVNANNIAGDRRKLIVYDLSDSETSPLPWASAEMWNIEQVNTNGVGELAFKNRGSKIEIIQLATNNGIASWDLTIPDKIALSTIAEARVDENMDYVPDRLGDTVRVVGVISTPNYQSTRTDHHLQDATAGIDFFYYPANLNLNIGDEIEVVGTIDQYNGLTEIIPLTPEDVVVLSSGNSVTPVKIKPADLGEDVEGSLVRMDSVWLVDPSAWPVSGSQKAVNVTDGADTISMYVDQDTELDGWTPPQGKMHLIAAASQYTTKTPPDNGYQLRATIPEHFIDLRPSVELVPDTLDFGLTAINGKMTMPVMFKNLGNTPVLIDSVTFSGSYFSTAFTDSAIAGEDSAEILVTFAPMITDPVEDVMTVHTPVATFSASLKGSGFVMWPLEWRVHADSSSSDWFMIKGAMENMVRGVAFNKMNNHIYAVSRVRGSFIWVLDGATGDTLKHLNTTGIDGGTYSINLISCTEDGQLIVGNLAAWGAQIFRLYHYKNEDDAPTMIIDTNFDVLGGRAGDAMAVSGSGNNLTVYVSGSNNANINTFVTTDGVNFAAGANIPLPAAGAANLGIAPVGDGSYLFTNGTGNAPRYLKSDGTVLYEFDTAVIPSGTSVNYFEVSVPAGVRRFIGITNGFGAGTSVIELKGTPGDELCANFELMAAPTEDYKVNDNLNATGMAVYNSISNSLVELISNNGISSYTMDLVITDAIKDTVISEISDLENVLPLVYALSQNYPNPFNPTTSFDIALPKTGHVEIDIYNILGQKVKAVFNGELKAGFHTISINATDLATGMYIYRMQAKDFVQAKKMVLMK